MGTAGSARQPGRSSSLETAVAAALQQLGCAFEQHVRMGPWVVDFYLADRQLVIECDGTYWHNLPASRVRDRKKNHWMRAHGVHLLRLVNDRAVLRNAGDLLRVSLQSLS
jgi:very-short-patch-repair endonuclease